VAELAVESRTILNPYVAKELDEGTLHVYFPRALEMPDAMTGPAWSVLALDPWRRVIDTGPVTLAGCQVISKDDPAGIF